MPASWRSSTLLAVTLAAGCGGETDPATPAHAGPVDAGTSGCPPGQSTMDDGSCQPAGIPPDRCAAGFVADDGGGCAPILPDTPCDKGLIAVPGDARCREIAPCGDGAWGAIPLEPTAQFVDGAFVGTSDGSQANPWQTIAEAIDAADPGGLVAITDGTYTENLVISSRPVRLWGRCPSKVAIVASKPASGLGFAVAVGAHADGTEIHDLALTGNGTGLVVLGSSDVLAERVWIHDTKSRGIELQPAAAPSSVHAKGSLIELTTGTGVTVASSTVTLEGTAIRDTKATPEDFGRAISAFRFETGDAASAIAVQGCLIERNHGSAVFVSSSSATIDATLVRGTLEAPDFPGIHGAKVQAAEGAPRGSLTVRGSVFEQNCIASAGSDLEVDSTVVRGTRGDVPAGGAGIAISNVLGTHQRAVGIVRASLIEDAQLGGITVKGSDATIDATLVRGTLIEPKSGAGAGIVVYHDPAVVERGVAVITSSLVTQNKAMGVLCIAADVTFEHSESSHNLPRDSDGLWGRGLQAQVDTESLPPVGATATIRGSAFVDNFEEGIAFAGATGTIEDVLVSARRAAPPATSSETASGSSAAGAYPAPPKSSPPCSPTTIAPGSPTSAPRSVSGRRP